MAGPSPLDRPPEPCEPSGSGPSPSTRDRRLPLPAGALRMLGRALARRCPVCGGRGVYGSWLSLREACPTCAMPFTREEGYWIGAVIVNLFLAQAALLAFLVGAIALTWPAPPWGWLVAGGVALMVVVPVVCHPYAKQLWLWIDLVVNPRGDAAAAAREAAQHRRDGGG